MRQVKSSTTIPEHFARKSSFMTHPVFNAYHSETQMLRYLHYLEGKDLALNKSMITLGSCTMKLNATSEMVLPPFSYILFRTMLPFLIFSLLYYFSCLFCFVLALRSLLHGQNSPTCILLHHETNAKATWK